jgi:flagellar protein FlaF
MQDSTSEARLNERAAFDRSIQLMSVASSKGSFSHDTITALMYVRQLWSILIDDLSSDDNQLPVDLKAQIVSLGIWMLAEADRIMKRESHDFAGMLEVSRTVRNALN